MIINFTKYTILWVLIIGTSCHAQNLESNLSTYEFLKGQYHSDLNTLLQYKHAINMEIKNRLEDASFIDTGVGVDSENTNPISIKIHEVVEKGSVRPKPLVDRPLHTSPVDNCDPGSTPGVEPLLSKIEGGPLPDCYPGGTPGVEPLLSKIGVDPLLDGKLNYGLIKKMEQNTILLAASNGNTTTIRVNTLDALQKLTKPLISDIDPEKIYVISNASASVDIYLSGNSLISK